MWRPVPSIVLSTTPSSQRTLYGLHQHHHRVMHPLNLLCPQQLRRDARRRPRGKQQDGLGSPQSHVVYIAFYDRMPVIPEIAAAAVGGAVGARLVLGAAAASGAPAVVAGTKNWELCILPLCIFLLVRIFLLMVMHHFPRTFHQLPWSVSAFSSCSSGAFGVGAVVGGAVGALGGDMLFGSASSADFELDSDMQRKVDLDADRVRVLRFRGQGRVQGTAWEA